jgi:hypothetical protein
MGVFLLQIHTQVNNYGPVPAGIYRKKSGQFRLEYCFHVRAISGVFLWDLVAVIFELGIDLKKYLCPLSISKGTVI